MKSILLEGRAVPHLSCLFRFTASATAIHLFSTIAYGASLVGVSFNTGSFEIDNLNGNPLSGGLPTVDHDGTVMQIGYLQPVQPGLSEWISLTGEGSANTAYAHSTIGDSAANGAGDGLFADFWLFTVGSLTTGQNLPVAGTRLSVRFFNATSLAEATAYQELTNPLWLWGVPAESPNHPVVVMSLDDPGTKMLFNRDLPLDGRIRTDVGTLIPEPTFFALLGTGAVALVRRRRKPLQ